MKKLSPIALAMALAFPVAAQAKTTTADLEKEIDALKKQIAELKAMVQQQAAKPAPAPAPAPAPVVVEDKALKAEVAKLRVKVEAIEDGQEASGFGGVKFSGFIDPTYVYNQRAGRGQFVFLNGGVDAAAQGSVNDLTADAWGYANSNFGGATLKFEKTFDNDMLASIRLRPYKSGSSTMVEEAFVEIPIGDGRRLVAGKKISFNGYELVEAPEMKNVTHNLLFDFGGPLSMTGVGMNFNALGMDWQTLAGNMNSDTDLPGSGNHNRGFHWRGDMEMSEFTGWGITGMHGTQSGSRYNYLGADFWHTRGDLNLNGQIEWSQHKNNAFNGGDAAHVGVSFLAALKLDDGWEAVGRVDWLDDHKNGGWRGYVEETGAGECLGVFDGMSSGMLATTCGDYRNGWGPGMYFDTVDGGWAVGNPDKGAKRTAFTLGLNYQFHELGLLKMEYRHDRSDMNTFYDLGTGGFKKSNNTFSVQTVVKF